MCGRLNVLDDPLAQQVFEQLNIRFMPMAGDDVCPGQTVSALSLFNGKIIQRNGLWGVKPEWSKRLIINAQVEGVERKNTFQDGFRYARLVVPCSGWYEWQSTEGKKSKYRFTPNDDSVLYMGALGLDMDRLVTLTTSANKQCAPFHHRMPLLFTSDQVEQWVAGSVSEAKAMLQTQWHNSLDIIKHV